ncbi:MAG: MFS transporter [Anaerolineaceae bacterium]|nr:MFS transporter [Anaerolineaceae bacterium]
MKNALKNHSLIQSLKRLKGNARGCVVTEPLFGIPYFLYLPYASIYMVALGVSDEQIGLIASISWGFQVLFALFSGVITDKLGRRKTTLFFDLISFSIPSLISAVAQNFWFFLIAGVINSLWRIVNNSWSCLLVEDTDPDELVEIYSWLYIAGLLVAFFAPLAGLLIKRFTLVPTVRGLYFFAAFMFTLKAIATYFLTQETEQGKIRMKETQGQSIFSALAEYKMVIRGMMRTPQTLITIGVMLVLSATGLVTGSFWGILVTEKLNIANQNLAMFQVIRSIFMLLFFFIGLPRIRSLPFKIPMIVSFIGLLFSQFVLIIAPSGSYFVLVLSIALEACSFATVGPLVDRMVVVTVDAKERARIQSLMYVFVILLTSPFGWIAGKLSSINKTLPFVLNIGLYLLGVGLALLAGKLAARKETIQKAELVL